MKLRAKSFYSPAKLNLFFRVLGKREDGFHEVVSLYGAIDLFDTITIAPSKADRFESDVLIGEGNLILKALQMFREKSAIERPLAISLKKKIPLGSGMGGGSSNAATTLWALNEMFDSPLSDGELKEMATKLGADVPFFLSSGFALCSGFGEKMIDVEPVNRSYVLEIPEGISCSTPEVYRECIRNESSVLSGEELLRQYIDGEMRPTNDLEPAAFRLKPELAVFKGELEKQYDFVSMTGSGSAFFCSGGKGKEVRLIQRGKGIWYQPHAQVHASS